MGRFLAGKLGISINRKIARLRLCWLVVDHPYAQVEQGPRLEPYSRARLHLLRLPPSSFQAAYPMGLVYQTTQSLNGEKNSGTPRFPGSLP
jgi:hypothetical protein